MGLVEIWADWPADKRRDFSRREQHHIETLCKRVDFLTARTDAAVLNGKNLTYDEEERSALRWGLGIILESEIMDEPDDSGERKPSREGAGRT